MVSLELGRLPRSLAVRSDVMPVPFSMPTKRDSMIRHFVRTDSVEFDYVFGTECFYHETNATEVRRRKVAPPFYIFIARTCAAELSHCFNCIVLVIRHVERLEIEMHARAATAQLFKRDARSATGPAAL